MDQSTNRTTPIRLGVIGTGKLGAIHVKLAKDTPEPFLQGCTMSILSVQLM